MEHGTSQIYSGVVKKRMGLMSEIIREIKYYLCMRDTPNTHGFQSGNYPNPIAEMLLDNNIEQHIDKEVEYVLDQYRGWVASGRKPERFCVMTNPRSMGIMHPTGWKCQYDDINAEIQRRYNIRLKELGWPGYLGYEEITKDIVKKLNVK